MLYRVAHGNLATPSKSTFSEKAADGLIERMQPYFSKPLIKIPVEDEVEEWPKLRLVHGWRK